MKYKSWENLHDWEGEYVEDLVSKGCIAWTDEEAYNRYKDINWIYDKYRLSQHLKQQVYLLDVNDPSEWPVIVKPRTNFEGMGKGAYKAYNKFDIKERKDTIAQPFYEGQHLSTDFAVFNGIIVDKYSFICQKDSNGSFTLFQSANKFNVRAYNFVSSLGLDYGIVNVETIGGNIIEAHLRPSVQFYDISGGLVERFLINYYNRSKTYKPSPFRKTYSRVIRQKHDGKPNFKEKLTLPLGVSSVQLCWYDGYYLSESAQDEYSYRVIVVNGTNLKNIDKYAEKLYSKISKSMT